MSHATPLSGPFLAPSAGGPADSLVVLLHGVGADGNDLMDLARDWAHALPTTAFSAPNAPFPCDLAPYGHQWFSLRDWSLASLLAGVQAAAPVLTRFLETERDRLGLDWSRLVLLGFSQGCMMGLHVAPRLPAPLAGVLGYSGALMGPELLAAQTLSRPPVLLVHGDGDEVVPVQATRAADAALRAAGIPVQTHIRPGLGHGIDGEGLRLGLAFIRSRLG